jgi:hypothetical protein
MGRPAVGYVQPRRRCGRCERINEIAVRADGDRPDVCVNCYRPPDATCRLCGRTRPCYYIGEGRPTCITCSPRRTAHCAHCGQQRHPTAHWPEGPVCAPCYDTALRRRGRCSGCGELRRLVAPPGPAATRCCDCAGTRPLARCAECGIEDKLYERARCERCTLVRRANQLLAGPDGTVPAALTGVHAAIAASAKPRKALNWLRNGAGAPILAAIATGTTPLTHTALDEHPKPRAADHVRQMLVAHGALPERDEPLARLERWIDDKLAAVDRPEVASLVRRFATWQVLRSLRRRVEHRPPNHRVATRYARNQVSTAIGILDWLHQRNITLSDCTQHDVDRWLAGPPLRREARHFLSWAARRGLAAKLTIRVIPEHPGQALDAEDRWAIARRLLHDDQLDLIDRVAGSFVLLYAQPLSRIAVMTHDQVTLHDDGALSVSFATHDVELPEPLAALVATLATGARHGHVGIGAPETTRWLFPGHLPGRPITPARLGTRLAVFGIDARAARRAALLQLAAELPAPVLAGSLGITTATAVDWVKAAGGDWANYAAEITRTRFATGR